MASRCWPTASGEEFAALLLDTDEVNAVAVAERIRHGFAGLTLLEPGFLSVSIGIAVTQRSGHELSRLLSTADEALYLAKGAGRNQVRVAVLSN
ncbi:GGDEF domain-containing protein [Pseudomonas fontis]|uniref:GGDEF domain-containing protein n=1 Tax=Pseudomonas fontis TaxID=2942633 RepID=UPI0030823910